MGYMNYYGGMSAGMEETVTTGNPFDWTLLIVILGSIVLGVVAGIILGKLAMKKRDL